MIHRQNRWSLTGRHYQRGRDAMNVGDLDDAIRLFQESAQNDPHFKTLELMGECYLKQGQHRQAVIPLAASVGLSSNPHRALYLLAQALDTCGHRDWAVERLRLAIEFKPDYKAARDLLNLFTANDS